jgi:hypothetical protein
MKWPSCSVVPETLWYPAAYQAKYPARLDFSSALACGLLGPFALEYALVWLLVYWALYLSHIAGWVQVGSAQRAPTPQSNPPFTFTPGGVTCGGEDGEAKAALYQGAQGPRATG